MTVTAGPTVVYKELLSALLIKACTFKEYRFFHEVLLYFIIPVNKESVKNKMAVSRGLYWVNITHRSVPFRTLIWSWRCKLNLVLQTAAKFRATPTIWYKTNQSCTTYIYPLILVVKGDLFGTSFQAVFHLSHYFFSCIFFNFFKETKCWNARGHESNICSADYNLLPCICLIIFLFWQA